MSMFVHAISDARGRIGLAAAIVLVAALFPPHPAGAAATDADTVAYVTPILSLWRDPNAFFVVQTGYGNFYYIGEATVPSDDGREHYRLRDPGQALLKAVFFKADGMAVPLRVSTKAKGVLLGVGDVSAELEPVPAPNPTPPAP